MCRRNQLIGLTVLGFGLGLLIGCWLESGFIRIFFAVIALLAGLLLLQKK